MTQPTEFSLESVRQLMLASGGRVTNHELVKSFRRWLTDPQGKETARAQFKDYVNTLATIKQENGEKFLILKKKFYPEYYSSSSGYVDAITPAGYSNPSQYDSYSTGYSTDNNYNSSSYTSDNYTSSYSNNRKQTSSYYEPSVNSFSSYEYSQPGFDHHTNYNTSHPNPSYTPSLTNGNGGSRGSPSLLDEVMAGFSPPSRTMGRQLPPLPSTQPNPHQSINSLGLPLPTSGPNSLGLPTRQDSHYQRQKSSDSVRASSSDLHYNPGYPATHHGQSQDQYPTHTDTSTGYNQGFNPHINHSQRNSVASVASYSSSNSYHGSPRGSYAPPPTGYASSPRASFASSPANYASPSNNYNAGSPRTSVAPPFSNSPRNSYAALPLTSQSSSTRPPPPYRAPPPEPAQHRPPPDRPKDGRTRPVELNLTRSADSVLPPVPVKSRHDSPPPPPKRTVPSESNTHNPPPLPRRPPPASATPSSLQPLDTGQAHRSRSQSTSLKISESQQPSPTDSGFTEDTSKFSDLLPPKNISLSKSFGNLSVDDDKFSKMEGSVSLDNLDALPNKETEKSISVKERTKTFNRMASETEIPSMSSASSLSKLPSAVKRRNSRAIDFGSRRGSNLRDPDNDTTDSSSITTIDPTIKQWMVHTAKGDYQTAAKMLMDDPKLSRHKDFTSGYSALHWACKHGNLDMVKLLAGTYQANVNAKSHGGYTPLHIAAMHNHQEVFDLLVQAYRADANIRDYAGKKPRQYMIVGDTGGMGLSMSSDTFRQLKDRRKNRTNRMEKNPGILRFGSLSVKVKKTTEAFNNYFRDGNESKPKWGDSDVEKMPPPKFAPIKKRKSKRTIDFGRTKSAPVTPTERSPIKEVIHEAAEENISDSDSEYGFGDKWGPGEKGVSHA